MFQISFHDCGFVYFSLSFCSFCTVYIFKNFFNAYSFLKERERESMCKQGRGREGDRGSKAGFVLTAESPPQGQTHKLRDHDLSQNQTLNRLSCPGTPSGLFLLKYNIHMEKYFHKEKTCTTSTQSTKKMMSTIIIRVSFPHSLLPPLSCLLTSWISFACSYILFVRLICFIAYSTLHPCFAYSILHLFIAYSKIGRAHV